MNTFPQSVIEAAQREREVTFTTFGRKTGNPSSVTIFVVTDGKRLFILSGQGMVRQWPQNLAARGEGVLHLGGQDANQNVKVKARHVSDPAETHMVAELYGSKYGPTFGPPKPGDPPKLSEQATFELIPAGS